MVISQKALFERLGAPLHNTLWSWGSVRQSDGVVFLRVWQDGHIKLDDKRFVWIGSTNQPSSSLGGNERLRHIELIESGSPCYMVMCLAVDPQAETRKIKSFNSESLFSGGELRLSDGKYLLEIKDRVPLKRIVQI